MRVMIARDYGHLSRMAADMVLSFVRKKPDCILAFPSGGTPVGMYSELVCAYREGLADFSGMRLFDIDTYYGLPLSDPHSHHSYITEHFASRTNLDQSKWFYLDPMAEDPDRFARAYEERIRSAGGIDLVLDGLGHNGHIGYNEPGSSFDSRTRVVDIAPRTREANSRFFQDPNAVPKKGLTMGIATILGARTIAILVSGREKAEVVRLVVEGPVTTDVPMTAIRYHPDARVILDEDAASLLSDETRRRAPR